MATADPGEEDNFKLELSRVREKVVTKFRELEECLNERKKKLLRQLDEILSCYESYKNEFLRVNEKKIALERSKSLNESQLSNSPIQSIQENILLLINTELKAMKVPKQPNLVSLCRDNNKKLLEEVSKFGTLIETVKSDIDYTNKTRPVLSVCEKGSGDGQLLNPYGVVIDRNTNNIYIADNATHCIKVFDTTGKYLFKFGDLQGEGKLSCPRGLAICGNRIIISQNVCILNYQLDGKFVSKIGKSGNGELEFNSLRGLTIDVINEDIYVCDCYNNRVQIISKDFKFKSEFGRDTLQYPRDVKVTEEFIFVLDESNPCLHLFDHIHNPQKSVISQGRGKQVTSSHLFYVDRNGNILISDYDLNIISIFNSVYEFIHKISVSKSPIGLTLDYLDRVVVVCQSGKECLQIF